MKSRTHPKAAVCQNAAGDGWCGMNDDHGDDHESDGHGHGDAALGPIDVAAWGAGLLGIGVALVMTLAFIMATSGPG
jgi:hypothetical protein